MSRFFKIVLAVVVVVLIFGYLSSDGCEGTSTISADEKYVLGWSSSSSAPVEVAKAFAKNGNRDCGEYYVRKSKEDQGEYLVACTRDGLTWNYYLVWTSTEKVVGPLSENFSSPR